MVISVKKKILSVIVPAYNVEKYIEKCLDSFEQIERKSDVEVIVVDDGSSDQTAVIARQYCERYPDIFYVYTKENGGHGSAINYGLKYVTGKYFKVVDADDWVDSKEMEQFLDYMEKNEVDVIASNFVCIQDETYKVLEK